MVTSRLNIYTRESAAGRLLAAGTIVQRPPGGWEMRDPPPALVYVVPVRTNIPHAR